MEDYQTHYRNQVVLITGGAGAIGSNLTRSIAELDARTVIVLDDLSASFEWNIPSLPNVLFEKGSVTDEIVLKRVFNEKPSIVFHLAAFFANQNSVDYPERDLVVNGLGTLRLLQYAELAGVERFVYASSGCSIYGSRGRLPLTEDQVSLHLTTPYQITKMLGELYGNFFYSHYNTQVVKARLFNSFGPGEVPGQYRNVVPNMLFRALNGQPLPLTGSVHATRDFTFVGDVVDALLRAGYFESAVGQEMNIATGEETRIVDVAEMINTLTGNTAGTVRAAPRNWDTKDRLCASIDHARNLIGYEPQVSFSEGLRQTLGWFRDNWISIQRDAQFPPGQSSATRGVLSTSHAVSNGVGH